MTPHAPAPEARDLREERHVHPGAVHVVFERRALAGEKSPARFLGAALQFLDRLAGDDLFDFPAARLDDAELAVGAHRVDRLAMALEGGVAFLRYFLFTHGAR